MSAPLTLVSDPSAELRAARAAGWSRWDLLWERWQEAAHAARAGGRDREAARLWLRADLLARLAFAADDPRRACSRANAAFAARLSGDEARARSRYAEAIRLWQGAGLWIERLEIAPRARSSLFHMRMEVRHRETYHARMRQRLAAFAAETAHALEALSRGMPPACRLYARWRGEKPGVFDDTRKLLGACLLVAA